MGGLYKDTTFKELQDDERLAKYGPFNSYVEAKNEWNRLSWQNVDSCNTRFIILPHK